MFKQKKAQTGETISWVVATIIILVIMMFFIFGASLLGSTKKVLQYKDHIFDSSEEISYATSHQKSVYTYIIMDDPILKLRIKEVFKLMNKRGDVPVTILVIGIFALCSLALFTFVVADIGTSNSFVGISEFPELNLKINQYKFLESQGVPLDRILLVTGAVEEDGEIYFYLEKKKGFFGGNGLEFSVKYKIS
jgi:hypothetical protein